MSRLKDIEAGLSTLRREYQALGIESIAMPALGCGNGGLEWSAVKSMIERYLGDLPIDIEVYEPSTAGEQRDEAERRPGQRQAKPRRKGRVATEPLTSAEHIPARRRVQSCKGRQAPGQLSLPEA